MNTQNAYTYRDFLNECENYNHSKEHYEIMKESAELMLMEQFHNAQVFSKHNTETFSEGYLMESVNEEYIAENAKEISAKAMNLIKKIGSSIINQFKRFFKWIQGLFNKVFKKQSEVEAMNKENFATMSEEEKAKFKEGIKESRKHFKKFLTPNKNVYATIFKRANMVDVIAEMDLFDDESFDDEFEESAYGYKLAGKKLESFKAKDDNVVSIDVIKKAYLDINDAIGSAHGVKSVNQMIKNAMGKTINIPLDEKVVDMPEIGIKIDLMKAVDQHDSEYVHELTELQETLNVVIPATSKFYAEMYEAIDNVYAIIAKHSKRRK